MKCISRMTPDEIDRWTLITTACVLIDTPCPLGEKGLPIPDEICEACIGQSWEQRSRARGQK
jgi:hypothetical protein